MEKKTTRPQLNIRTDNELLARLKQESDRSGKSITAIVIEAIRRLLGMDNG